MELIENILKKGVENRLFTGASVGVYTGWNNRTFFQSFGTTESECRKNPVKNSTFFDLASLTKPLVTVLLIGQLIENKRLNINDTLDKFFNFTDSYKKKVTIGNMLSHSSGFPAHRKFYEKCHFDCLNYVIEQILQIKLENEPGSVFNYSDLGFIILGRIIEITAGETLEKLWFTNIASPLSLKNNLTFQVDKLNRTNCCLTKNLINPEITHCGEVHDDNCRVLGGKAGHAGLFGNIEGVMCLCQNMLDTVKKRDLNHLLKRETLLKLFRKRAKSTWAYGFDTPSQLYSSSGKFFSKNSVGHLGFTGTSFWLDLDQDIAVVLLTNRAYYPDSLSKMKKYRPYFHDKLMKYFLNYE